MAVQKSVIVGSVLGMMLSFKAMSLDDISRKSCPSSLETNYSLTQAELQQKLQGMPELKAATQLHHNFMESFVFEYEKFPQALRQQIAKAGGYITLLEGNGVAEDPNWVGVRMTTDGRDWAKVPGSGGSVFSHPVNPTRIVINHIYERSQNYGHGSTNLILHEHAHTLDHLYRVQNISGTKAWRDLLANPVNRETIRRIFTSYEANSELESFAELFAYYHACPETRAHLYQVLPEAANILANLNVVKKNSGSRRNAVVTAPVEREESAPTRPRRRFSFKKLFNDIGDGVDDLINPDNN